MLHIQHYWLTLHLMCHADGVDIFCIKEIENLRLTFKTTQLRKPKQN